MVLRPIRVEDEEAFRRAVKEFHFEGPEGEFAFAYDEQEPFAKYVTRVFYWSLGLGLEPKHVPHTYLIATVDDDIVGRVSIRHELNTFLRELGGHIGYGVLPQHRRKGYGREMLRLALPIAHSLGILKALVTCDDDNTASIRIIEANGGVLENVIFAPGLPSPKRRYWICT